MTPLEALANLKHALDLYGIHHDRFADAVEEALAVLAANQCGHCGCLLKASEQRIVEGRRICRVCIDYYDRWVKK